MNIEIRDAAIRSNPRVCPASECPARLLHPQGGVSSGIYAGLNVGLGSDDDPVLVRQNRARVAAALGWPDRPLSTPHQVHSPDVVTISEPFDERTARRSTPSSPRRPASSSACWPPIAARSSSPTKRGGVVAAAHAGWKGAFTGVIENTVEAMIAAGARRESIRAVLGPSIGPKTTRSAPNSRPASPKRIRTMRRFFSPVGARGHFHVRSARLYPGAA
jgi:copper oxidase (laccase) domain-containing protein